MSEHEQKSEMVRQHKRIAMGVKLDGQSQQPKGEKSEPKKGAHAQLEKKPK